MVEKSNILKNIGDIVKIQIIICFFSMINVLSKYASKFDFLTWKFILIYCGVLFSFILYAFFWQKLLKKHSLFKVYSNRALLVVYSLIWGILLFAEKVTVYNILGIILIIVGIIVVFSDDK